MDPETRSERTATGFGRRPGAGGVPDAWPDAGLEAGPGSGAGSGSRSGSGPGSGPEPGPGARPEAEPTETVLIRVPADPDYLAVIRSATAHVATRLGGTLSEVSDLRLAVDEACGLLLRHTVRAGDAAKAGAGAGDLECRFVLDGPALRVLLSLPGRDAVRPDPDEFGWTILAALVDAIDWRVEDRTVHVEILKHRTAGR